VEREAGKAQKKNEKRGSDQKNKSRVRKETLIRVVSGEVGTMGEGGGFNSSAHGFEQGGEKATGGKKRTCRSPVPKKKLLLALLLAPESKGSQPVKPAIGG